MRPPPHPRIRRLAEAWLRPDDWATEFLDALDEACRARHPGAPGLRSRTWYVGQLLAPRSLAFYGLLRRRRRAERRNARGRWTMGGWIFADVRMAVRTLLRDRRFAFFGVATLALGVAGVATMFGVADRLFLRGPRHLQEPERLARLYLRFEEPSGPRTTAYIPWLTYRGMAAGETGFQGMVGYRYLSVAAELPDGARRLEASAVDEGYFDVLGVAPARGRFFDPADPDDADAVVLAFHLWRRAFGADPGVVGRTFTLAGRDVTVVGVAPDGFSGPGMDRVDLWLPLVRERAGSRNWWVVARLADGSPSGDAARTAAAGRADRIHDRTDPGRSFQWAREGTVVAAPLGYDDAGEEPAEAAVARLLVAVCVLVLLLACVNVVNLSLARMTRRAREIGVRRALGIGRARLVGALLSESALLGLGAAAAALPLTWVAGSALRDLLFPGVAWTASPLEPRVVAAAVVAAVAASLAVGGLPALSAAGLDVQAALRSGAASRSRSRGRLHTTLATGQVTLAVTLLLAAGLLFRSFWALRHTDLGYDEDEVFAVTLSSVDPDRLRSGSPEDEEAYRRALEAARALPGVRSAALSLGAPFIAGFGTSLRVPGLDSIPELPGGGPWYSAVTPGYFETMGTGIVRGRPIEASDDETPVVVVSESMADLLWPGREALGACLGIGRVPCHRVVGIARNVHRQGYSEPPSMQFYIPLPQSRGFGGTALLVRARDRGGDLAPLRERLLRLGGGIDLVEIRRLSTFLEEEIRPWRMGAVALTLAAGLATVVALLGVYGVLAYLVAQRQREIGVRMALGASAARVRGMVLRSGLASSALGIVLGGLLLVPVLRWIRPLLHETAASDPWVLGVVTALVLGVTALACLLPARQASRIEPVGALRAE